MQIVNIHGRKRGRGIRPWLLLPKYLCVSLALGGLSAIAVLSTLRVPDSGIMANSLLQYQVFPALAGASVLGILLLVHHGRVMLKMRWLWAKLGLIVVAALVVHLVLKGQVAREQVSPRGAIGYGAALSALAFVLVAVVGRLKPRLGQKYNRPG